MVVCDIFVLRITANNYACWSVDFSFDASPRTDMHVGLAAFSSDASPLKNACYLVAVSFVVSPLHNLGPWLLLFFDRRSIASTHAWWSRAFSFDASTLNKFGTGASPSTTTHGGPLYSSPLNKSSWGRRGVTNLLLFRLTHQG